jgi:P27 family predicted phage terminase small subunit
MGARGPTPKPAWKKRLEGNPGKRPIKESVKAPPGRPTCPTWLDEGARATWARLAPELEKRDLLTPLDRDSFALYCQSYSAWAEAEQVLAERVRFYVGPGGKLRERPEVTVAERAMKNTVAIGREFGLTPVSRARLNLLPPDDEDDEFDRFLSRKPSGLLDR